MSSSGGSEDAGRGSEIGHFLKARRTELRPEQLGFPASSDPRRRTPGLRREEVAALARISADYYARIEQGRRTAPLSTLDAIARVLRLDDASRDYLCELSGKAASQPRQRRAQKAAPHLVRVLHTLTDIPALVLGRRMDVLAWNSVAAALFVDFASVPERQRNYVRIVFTHPAMRTLYRAWASSAQLCVAQLHMEAARDPQDPQLAALVGELSLLDADFRRWWSAHRVAVRSHGTKELDHPAVGELTLDWDTLAWAEDPDQQLIIWTAEPGSVSEERLRTLAAGASPATGDGFEP
ncbi:helix-turn-helix domain-containing protein [Petropleomorpha daqingensis]|uniref:Transcriptional regulator with XRE-family HTH domain n=1 Tax=Petropleomorpha daqingensis TaxID=2026353 RepID=A0A853CKG5_9ACTN|nr:helix-turn-helix domain-containing protein [Petropleomorpha daqingensis]NYJ08057.1 transcriptional regulator with XRE-family HTH domain [Petropleomorpha daqingensis]